VRQLLYNQAVSFVIGSASMYSGVPLVMPSRPCIGGSALVMPFHPCIGGSALVMPFHPCIGGSALVMPFHPCIGGSALETGITLVYRGLWCLLLVVCWYLGCSQRTLVRFLGSRRIHSAV
jgi:hypothetical protein